MSSLPGGGAVWIVSSDDEVVAADIVGKRDDRFSVLVAPRGEAKTVSKVVPRVRVTGWDDVMDAASALAHVKERTARDQTRIFGVRSPAAICVPCGEWRDCEELDDLKDWVGEDRAGEMVVILGEDGDGRGLLRKWLSFVGVSGKKPVFSERWRELSWPFVGLEKVGAGEVLLEAFGCSRTGSGGRLSHMLVSESVGMGVWRRDVSVFLSEELCRADGSSRNFNVFYYLLRGATESQLRLAGVNEGESVMSFRLLDRRARSAGVAYYDAERWTEFLRALATVGVTSRNGRLATLLRVVVGVLCLGNVGFVEGERGVQVERSNSWSDHALLRTAELLGIGERDIVQMIRGADVSESADRRDALCATIYTGLVRWALAAGNTLIENSLGTDKKVKLVESTGRRNGGVSGNYLEERIWEVVPTCVARGEERRCTAEGMEAAAASWSSVRREEGGLVEGPRNAGRTLDGLFDTEGPFEVEHSWGRESYAGWKWSRPLDIGKVANVLMESDNLCVRSIGGILARMPPGAGEAGADPLAHPRVEEAFARWEVVPIHATDHGTVRMGSQTTVRTALAALVGELAGSKVNVLAMFPALSKSGVRDTDRLRMLQALHIGPLTAANSRALPEVIPIQTIEAIGPSAASWVREALGPNVEWGRAVLRSDRGALQRLQSAHFRRQNRAAAAIARMWRKRQGRHRLRAIVTSAVRVAKVARGFLVRLQLARMRRSAAARVARTHRRTTQRTATVERESHLRQASRETDAVFSLLQSASAIPFPGTSVTLASPEPQIPETSEPDLDTLRSAFLEDLAQKDGEKGEKTVQLSGGGGAGTKKGGQVLSGGGATTEKDGEVLSGSGEPPKKDGEVLSGGLSMEAEDFVRLSRLASAWKGDVQRLVRVGGLDGLSEEAYLPGFRWCERVNRVRYLHRVAWVLAMLTERAIETTQELENQCAEEREEEEAGLADDAGRRLDALARQWPGLEERVGAKWGVRRPSGVGGVARGLQGSLARREVGSRWMQAAADAPWPGGEGDEDEAEDGVGENAGGPVSLLELDGDFREIWTQREIDQRCRVAWTLAKLDVCIEAVETAREAAAMLVNDAAVEAQTEQQRSIELMRKEEELVRRILEMETAKIAKETELREKEQRRMALEESESIRLREHGRAKAVAREAYLASRQQHRQEMEEVIGDEVVDAERVIREQQVLGVATDDLMRQAALEKRSMLRTRVQIGLQRWAASVHREMRERRSMGREDEASRREEVHQAEVERAEMMMLRMALEEDLGAARSAALSAMERLEERESRWERQHEQRRERSSQVWGSTHGDLEEISRRVQRLAHMTGEVPVEVETMAMASEDRRSRVVQHARMKSTRELTTGWSGWSADDQLNNEIDDSESVENSKEAERIKGLTGDIDDRGLRGLRKHKQRRQSQGRVSPDTVSKRAYLHPGVAGAREAANAVLELAAKLESRQQRRGDHHLPSLSPSQTSLDRTMDPVSHARQLGESLQRYVQADENLRREEEEIEQWLRTAVDSPTVDAFLSRLRESDTAIAAAAKHLDFGQESLEDLEGEEDFEGGGDREDFERESTKKYVEGEEDFEGGGDREDFERENAKKYVEGEEDDKKHMDVEDVQSSIPPSKHSMGQSSKSPEISTSEWDEAAREAASLYGVSELTRMRARRAMVARSPPAALHTSARAAHRSARMASALPPAPASPPVAAAQGSAPLPARPNLAKHYDSWPASSSPSKPTSSASYVPSTGPPPSLRNPPPSLRTTSSSLRHPTPPTSPRSTDPANTTPSSPYARAALQVSDLASAPSPPSSSSPPPPPPISHLTAQPYTSRPRPSSSRLAVSSPSSGSRLRSPPTPPPLSAVQRRAVHAAHTPRQTLAEIVSPARARLRAALEQAAALSPATDPLQDMARRYQ